MTYTSWILVLEIIYTLLVLFTCIRVVLDTRTVSKALAYLLLVIFIPFFGIVFYFSFGINYRKRKIYTKKISVDEKHREQLKGVFEKLKAYSNNSKNTVLEENRMVQKLLEHPSVGNAILFPYNTIKILYNGENAFPEILKALKEAKNHIHIEYYIFENDTIGNQIKDILIEKVKKGVKVRFLYDDFGSMNIRKNIVKELHHNGIEVYPFHKIKLIYLANRLNYRNHRKIIIVDGVISFTGGINISDRYSNDYPNKHYWRDTHLKMVGMGTYGLQHIFLMDWNFATQQSLTISSELFPIIDHGNNQNSTVQVISSGPDSDEPSILYSIVQAINTAKKQIYITTPYYIPDTTLQTSIILAAFRGLDVRLLIPYKGDNLLVNLASESYFEELLSAGVKIYRYNKGFIHAKTFVVDRSLSSVGTSNLDIRSFELNFENSVIIYDQEIGEELSHSFENDLKESIELNRERWKKRSFWKRILQKWIRLFSPFF